MAAVTASQPTPIITALAGQSSSPLRYVSPTYTSQASITPPDSSSSSPRSPQYALPSHMQSQAKQLRTPRSPMYVPAVLRPTEHLTRQSPPKGSLKSSLDGSDTDEEIPEEGQTVLIRRVVTEEWNEARMGPVTGPPSRNHWKPDTSSPTCDSPTCARPFSWLHRRHHCRRCGSIFCGPHSVREVPLDQHARFHPRAPSFRACDDCYRDFRLWDKKRLQKLGELDEQMERLAAADGEVDPATTAVPAAGKAVDIGVKKSIIGTIAQSVPRDWSWSTF